MSEEKIIIRKVLVVPVVHRVDKPDFVTSLFLESKYPTLKAHELPMETIMNIRLEDDLHVPKGSITQRDDVKISIMAVTIVEYEAGKKSIVNILEEIAKKGGEELGKPYFKHTTGALSEGE